MRWAAGPSYELAERIRESWHPWFSWHPVKTNEGQWVWLENVERRGFRQHPWTRLDPIDWSYRLPR